MYIEMDTVAVFMKGKCMKSGRGYTPVAAQRREGHFFIPY